MFKFLFPELCLLNFIIIFFWNFLNTDLIFKILNNDYCTEISVSYHFQMLKFTYVPVFWDNFNNFCYPFWNSHIPSSSSLTKSNRQFLLTPFHCAILAAKKWNCAAVFFNHPQRHDPVIFHPITTCSYRIIELWNRIPSDVRITIYYFATCKIIIPSLQISNFS